VRWSSYYLITLIFLISLSAFAASDAGFMPPRAFAPDWSPEGPPRVYEGDALYDLIDGGGEIFLELGFEACTVQRYRKGTEELELDLYRMADPAAALGIYLMNCGRESPDKRLAERHTVGQSQLLLVKNRYYLVATSPESGPGMSAVLVEAAKAVAGHIPPAEPPPCLSWLPKEGLDPRSVRILRGPIGLQAIVTLGEGDVLQLRHGTTAVAGDFRAGDGQRATVIVARYGSELEAAAALRNLAQNLDSELSVVSTDDRGLTFKDRKGLYGRATVDGRLLSVRLGLAQKPAS